MKKTLKKSKKVLTFGKLCDIITIMSVFPGFGGQKFISEVLDKCRAISRLIDSYGIDCQLEIDGGINVNNCNLAVEAGCTVLVVGSAVFNSEDMTETIKRLRCGK